MEIDIDRIDQAVLALLYLGLHDGCRAWKDFGWDAMERLHGKGLISDPVGKAKSVAFTDEGLREAERLFRELFAGCRCRGPGRRDPFLASYVASLADPSRISSSPMSAGSKAPPHHSSSSSWRSCPGLATASRKSA
jgi:Domain of unknown function (DUF6429)